MSNQDEGEEGGLDLQGVVDHIIAMLKAANIPEEVGKDFVCLRAHLLHAWGIMHVVVNGEASLAIIRPADDEGLLKAAFILPTPKMKITDTYGNPADKHFQLLSDPPQAKAKLN
jgi:hypothetical protein